MKKLIENQHILKYFKNSSWMMIEYLFKFLSAIVVVIYIARFLGPSDYGLLSYALAIVAILMAIGRLGMESILVRDLAKQPKLKQQYMGTAFFLMNIFSLVGILILGGLIHFFETDFQTKVYIWIISLGVIFQTFLVIDYNFQAQVQAKYSAISKSIAITISSLIKIYLVLIEADLILFVIAFVLDHIIIAVLLTVMYLLKKEPFFVASLDTKLIKPLLKSAWPIVISALAIMLYMRIDQIMIKNMLNIHELGLYSAATKIYEGWIMVPYALSISLLPAIVKLKENTPDEYEKNMSKLFAILFWLGILAATISTFASEYIITLTFGNAYISSQYVLIIIMWTAAFTALGSVSTRYLTVEGMEKKIASRTVLALVLNVGLNFLLIPQYGIEGAAIATLITIVTANYLINYIDKELKQLLNICNKAITLNFLRDKRPYKNA